MNNMSMEYCNVVLENVVENQFGLSCEKWKSVT